MREIYCVEDDSSIAAILKTFLEQKGFRITLFSTLKAAQKALRCCRPSVILLDWNMPDGEGLWFCRWLRSVYSDLPVIFLTVRGDPREMIAGLDGGADDYVTKPFELEVLHSRILALLRRSGSTQSLSCGPVAVDLKKMTVLWQNVEVSLSHTEYQLLVLLMKNKGKTVTRQRLLEEIWDNTGSFVNNNTLTVTMKRLREKLHQPACLKTIRSFGYRMEDPV